MITKWWKIAFKNYVCNIFNNGSGLRSYSVPIKNVQNTVYYPANSPTGSNPGFATSATGAGISVGTGNAAATDQDYNLQSTITSGLSAVITKTAGEDGSKVYVTFNIVFTNTTDSDITIKEIGIKNNINCASTAGATSGFSARVCLLDRTVLPEPVVVPARGNAAILYRINEEYTF